MTMGRMANILAIQEKLVRLISAENQQGTRIGTKTFLQESSPDSLNWTDARLDSFLENAVRAKFSVRVQKKNIKITMNGWSPTVGDLAIAVFLAVERQHKTGSVTLGHKAPSVI
jgi:hypothetical protein